MSFEVKNVLKLFQIIFYFLFMLTQSENRLFSRFLSFDIFIDPHENFLERMFSV